MNFNVLSHQPRFLRKEMTNEAPVQMMWAPLFQSLRCFGLITKLKSGSARNRTWGLPRPQTTRVCCPLHHWTRISFKIKLSYIQWMQIKLLQCDDDSDSLYIWLFFNCNSMFACIKSNQSYLSRKQLILLYSISACDEAVFIYQNVLRPDGSVAPQ